MPTEHAPTEYTSLVKRYTIFKALVGSRAYGTYTSESDYDYRMVYALPVSYYISLDPPEDSIALKDVQDGRLYDVTYTDLRKFLKGLLSSNINYLEMIHSPRIDVDVYQLASQKHVFATKRLYQSLRGFALQQSKIKGFSLDKKSMLHAFRFVYMGIHFFETGVFEVQTDRFYCPLVYELCNGTFTLNTFASEFTALLTRLDTVYSMTTVPDEPCKDVVEGLLQYIYKTQSSTMEKRW